MQKFSLHHIKSFLDSGEIEIKPITVFVGKNSSGKSSILRFPVVLAQTFREDAVVPLLLFGNMIDYGNYDDVAYRHGSNPLEFEVYFGQELIRFIKAEMRYFGFILRHRNQDYIAQKTSLRVQIRKKLKRLEVKEEELILDGEKVFTYLCDEKGRNIIRIHRTYNGEKWEELEKEVLVEDIHFQKFIPVIDEIDMLYQLCGVEKQNNRIDFGLLVEDFAEDLRDYVNGMYSMEEIQNLYNTIVIIKRYLGGILRQLESEAGSMAYIGPFRENPKRIYRDSESSYNDVGVNGENTCMILRQAAEGNPQVLEKVSGWLQSSMGCELGIKEQGNGLYSLVVKGNGETDNIIDVGYGISQVIPIVTQLYAVNKNSYHDRVPGIRGRKMMIFEQPELHLHPAAQAQLADLFVDCIVDKSSAVNRIVIETHSEHLIRKLQVLAADPEVAFNSDQVVFYYVDKDNQENSYVKKMELCSNGQFAKAWPTGFFDKSYELTRLLLKAKSKAASAGGSK